MPCSSIYCINGAGSYDGNYGVAPTSHNGYDYFTGDTLPTYYIFSSVTENSWCLSTVLDGPCLLFGKSPCLSNCPDLCDNFFGIGPCLTPTPTPTPSQVPPNCFEYLIENLDPFSSNLYDYKDCSDSFVSVLIPASGSVTICASVAPMDSTFSITLIGPCLI